MEPEPERLNGYLLVELHNVRVLRGVGIRVRWQEQDLAILLLDVIDAHLMRWTLLGQHHLHREGDD